MTAIQDSDAPYIADPSFDPASYIREVFGMYHDALQRVTLLCENRTMRNIIDHFGEDVNTEIVDAKHFRLPWMWRPRRRSSHGYSPSAALSASRGLADVLAKMRDMPRGCVHKSKRDPPRKRCRSLSPLRGRRTAAGCIPAAVLLILVRKVYRPANGCKALDAGDHHIVVSAGAVDDEQIAALVPAAYNAHMGVLWIEYQIAGQRLVPRDSGAVGMLRGAPPPCPMMYSPPVAL